MCIFITVLVFHLLLYTAARTKAINTLKEAIVSVKKSKLAESKRCQFIIEIEETIKSVEDEMTKNSNTSQPQKSGMRLTQIIHKY